MNISRNTLKDALWWVETELENCDLSRKDYIRTKRCRDELKAFLQNSSQPNVQVDGLTCGRCGKKHKTWDDATFCCTETPTT